MGLWPIGSPSTPLKTPTHLKVVAEKRWAASQASGPSSVEGPSANQSQHGDIQVDTEGRLVSWGNDVSIFPEFAARITFPVASAPDRLLDQELIEFPLVAIGLSS